MSCPHGMPTPGSCTDCMDEGPVAQPPRWKAVGTPFPALHESSCPGNGCTSWIYKGERIRRWDRGDTTAYTHESCRP